MGGNPSRQSDVTDGQSTVASPLPRPQTPEEQDFLTSVAQTSGLTREEVDIIWRRYQWLRPDERRLIDTSAFNAAPFSSDWFLEKVARSLPVKEDGQSIDFESFVSAVKNWKESNVEGKLRNVFSILAGERQCIDSNKMHELLMHLRPSEDKDALKQSADSIVNAMGTQTGKISEEDFLQWLLQEIGEETLEPLLNFTLEDSCSRNTQLEEIPADPEQSSTL